MKNEVILKTIAFVASQTDTTIAARIEVIKLLLTGVGQ